MADIFSSAKRSEVMRQIKAKDTVPELRVRRSLHSKGYRFILHDKRLPGTPDIVLPKYRAVIQVRGCFWHGHICKDGHIPKTRREYWQNKLLSNSERDRRNDKKLRKMGWKVIVVWECRTQSKAKLGKSLKYITQRLGIL